MGIPHHQSYEKADLWAGLNSAWWELNVLPAVQWGRVEPLNDLMSSDNNNKNEHKHPSWQMDYSVSIASVGCQLWDFSLLSVHSRLWKRRYSVSGVRSLAPVRISLHLRTSDNSQRALKDVSMTLVGAFFSFPSLSFAFWGRISVLLWTYESSYYTTKSAALSWRFLALFGIVSLRAWECSSQGKKRRRGFTREWSQHKDPINCRKERPASDPWPLSTMIWCRYLSMWHQKLACL